MTPPSTLEVALLVCRIRVDEGDSIQGASAPVRSCCRSSCTSSCAGLHLARPANLASAALQAGFVRISPRLMRVLVCEHCD